MKKTWVIWLGAAAVILAGGILCYTIFFTGMRDTVYYTQVDNTRISRAGGQGMIDLSGNGGMDFSYTLPSYREDGGQEDITFGVPRELREGAFLCLTVRPGRGVMTWAEVQYDELPPAVRAHYAAPEDGQEALRDQGSRGASSCLGLQYGQTSSARRFFSRGWTQWP